MEIIAALIAVLGTLGGVCLGNSLAKRAARDLLAQQAKNEFASVFARTLANLHAEEDEGDGRHLQILQDDFPIHFAAYLKLCAVLPSSHRESVEAAWEQYSQDGQYSDEEQEMYRFSHVLSPDRPEHRRMLAIKHVKEFLGAIAN